MHEKRIEYDSISTEKYWNEIQRKEQEGKPFIDVEGLYDYQIVSLIRTVECPLCGEEQKIDLDDYLWGDFKRESV